VEAFNNNAFTVFEASKVLGGVEKSYEGLVEKVRKHGIVEVLETKDFR